MPDKTNNEMDEKICESCPLNDVEAYYSTKEQSTTEFSVYDIASHDPEVLIFVDDYLKSKVQDPTTGAWVWASMYIGPRPPKKPVKS